MVELTLPVSHRLARSVWRWLLFVSIGVVVAAVGELQFSVLVRGDWANLYGSMVFNAVYLSGAFLVTLLIFRLLPQRLAFLVGAVLAAAGGLAVEWFLIGNSPWGNPDANQIGMAAYWAGMVLVPWLLIDSDPRLRPLKRVIGFYALGYVALAALGQGLIQSIEWHYAFHVWTVVIGYVGLVALVVVGYLRAVGLRLSPSLAA